MMQYDNNFVKTGHPINSSDIAHIESTFNFIFPTAIKEHYLRHNGGRPERNVLKIDDTFFVVSEFFPIKYGKSNCLFEDVYRDLKIEQDIMPTYLIPFADDPGGDYYCFSINKENNGSIWIYRGEYLDDINRAVVFIAASLTAFVENMISDGI